MVYWKCNTLLYLCNILFFRNNEWFILFRIYWIRVLRSALNTRKIHHNFVCMKSFQGHYCLVSIITFHLSCLVLWGKSCQQEPILHSVCALKLISESEEYYILIINFIMWSRGKENCWIELAYMKPKESVPGKGALVTLLHTNGVFYNLATNGMTLHSSMLTGPLIAY